MKLNIVQYFISCIATLLLLLVDNVELAFLRSQTAKARSSGIESSTQQEFDNVPPNNTPTIYYRSSNRYKGNVYTRKRKPEQFRKSDQSQPNKYLTRKRLHHVSYEELSDTPSESSSSESETKHRRVIKKPRENTIISSPPEKGTKEKSPKSITEERSRNGTTLSQSEKRSKKTALWYKWYQKQKELRKSGNPEEKAKAEAYFKKHSQQQRNRNLRKKQEREAQNPIEQQQQQEHPENNQISIVTTTVPPQSESIQKSSIRKQSIRKKQYKPIWDHSSKNPYIFY